MMKKYLAESKRFIEGIRDFEIEVILRQEN